MRSTKRKRCSTHEEENLTSDNAIGKRANLNNSDHYQSKDAYQQKANNTSDNNNTMPNQTAAVNNKRLLLTFANVMPPPTFIPSPAGPIPTSAVLPITPLSMGGTHVLHPTSASSSSSYQSAISQYDHSTTPLLLQLPSPQLHHHLIQTAQSNSFYPSNTSGYVSCLIEASNYIHQQINTEATHLNSNTNNVINAVQAVNTNNKRNNKKQKVVNPELDTSVPAIAELPSQTNQQILTATITANSSNASTNATTITIAGATTTGTGRRRGRPPKSATSTSTTKLTLGTKSTSNLQRNKILTSQSTSNLNVEKIQKEKSITSSANNLNNITISNEESLQEIYKLYSSQNKENDIKPGKSPMPNLNWANGDDLWRVMRMKEVKYKHDVNYLKRHQGIESQMRAILLDWLNEISYAYRLHRETFHLAIEYMDRFMTLSKQQMRVDRLQLIGMTCLFMAAKVEEIYPPKLKEFASHMENYSNNNEDAIQQFELFLLKTLNWEISPVTANTWLMAYLQIASINYYTHFSPSSSCASSTNSSFQEVDEQQQQTNSIGTHKLYNTHIVMPLHIYKNTNLNLKDYLISTQTSTTASNRTTLVQQQFYLNNYMKSISLLDLCMFDMESLKFSYSVLAASAMYLMVSNDTSANQALQSNASASSSSSSLPSHIAVNLIQKCTGYKMHELDQCIRWMYPYADVCREIITEKNLVNIKTFNNIDKDDSHNIQLYNNNLQLIKEANIRKTPSKYSSNNYNQYQYSLLTPPESHRKSPNTSTYVMNKSNDFN